MAAGEELVVWVETETESDQCLLWTPGFPMKTLIYIKETQNRVIVEEEKKTIYMNIFMST